jgi:predicted nuclease of predicted toxin-antitoxin system
MTLKFVIDMNLSPRWAAVFQQNGWHAVHWSAVGDPRAPDALIMAWAREHQCVVYTHDLDFGALLALTHAGGPSVIQVRAQDVLPEHLADTVVGVVRRCQDVLDTGALVIVDEHQCRVRILPLLP